jgi:hypothetical protein
VTRQSDVSYLCFRGVTKWATQACTIPYHNTTILTLMKAHKHHTLFLINVLSLIAKIKRQHEPIICRHFIIGWSIARCRHCRCLRRPFVLSTSNKEASYVYGMPVERKPCHQLTCHHHQRGGMRSVLLDVVVVVTAAPQCPPLSIPGICPTRTPDMPVHDLLTPPIS